MIHRHLKNMVENGEIIKIGTAPQVFYEVNFKKEKREEIKFKKNEEKILEKEFYFIDPSGKELSGVDGFVLWCQRRNFDIQKKKDEFLKIYQKYKKLRENNLINASFKIKESFGGSGCVDKIFYYDFYSLEVFGKTKIGQKILYAKQSQDKKRIFEIVDEIEKSLKNLIKKEKIDSVIFVPPTIPREVQFMKILENRLKLNLAKINIRKQFSDLRVPQKTLKKIKDRIENADKTFFVVDENLNFKKTLIIDDAVGSGASINQIACKLKKQKNSKKVIGFSIVGSVNGFDIINEV